MGSKTMHRNPRGANSRGRIASGALAALPLFAAVAAAADPAPAGQEPAETGAVDARALEAGTAEAGTAETGTVETGADDLNGGAIPARAGELVLSWDEFHAALLDREGGSEAAQVALVDLGERALLGELAAEGGIRVTEDDLADRFAELDAQLRDAGVEGGLAAELERAGVPLEEFKERLRLQVVLEALVRADLSIPDDRPCPAEQQQLWLDAKLAEAGLERLPRPWDDGVVARLGERTFSADALARALRQQLPPEELRELCFQLLLAKAVEARLPDLSAEGRAAAIDAEVARRRAETEADPRYQGVAFERLLEARGLTLEFLRRDPAVRIAALSTHFVDAKHGEAGLRAVYEAERDWFEDHHGRAVDARILYLIAAPERGPLTPRNYSDATAVLVDLASEATSEAAFDRLAREHSEDPLSRERGGRLGFVTRAAEGVPAALREELFTQLDAGRTGLVGPLRLDNGMALLWIGTVRPSPPWEQMREHVHRELRRRFLVETLPPTDVVTHLDGAR